MITPVDRLFETHLVVADLDASIAFYRDRVGLELAHVIPAATGRVLLGRLARHHDAGTVDRRIRAAEDDHAHCVHGQAR